MCTLAVFRQETNFESRNHGKEQWRGKESGKYMHENIGLNRFTIFFSVQLFSLNARSLRYL